VPTAAATLTTAMTADEPTDASGEAASSLNPPIEPAQVAAPGFYPDPRDPSRELYWDGDKWTNEAAISVPDPGFYPDPNDPKVERYWDGKRWTESRQPVGVAQAVPANGEKQQEASGIIIAGYIFAVLMPIVGFILGLTQVNRNRHGIWVVVVSVIAFIVWLAIFDAQQTNDLR
jgi:Protein of unknown function (DUF2510)